VFAYQAFDFVDLSGIKTIIASKLHWIKPKFGFIAGSLDVNMRRFVALVAEKMEAISTDSQDGWHIQSDPIRPCNSGPIASYGHYAL
jgi:hypothetical protein